MNWQYSTAWGGWHCCLRIIFSYNQLKNLLTRFLFCARTVWGMCCRAGPCPCRQPKPAATCAKQIQQTKEKAKELKNGPSAPDYKVDDHLLDVPDDEDIVVKDDSTATKNQINYQKKVNKTLLVNNLNLFISLHSFKRFITLLRSFMI